MIGSFRKTKSLLVGAIAGVGLLVVGCTARPPEDPGQVSSAIEMVGVGMRLFRGSELRSEGRAKKVTYFRNSGTGVAQDVLLKIARPSEEGGKIDITVATVKGDIRSQEAYGSQGIKAQEASGATGTTERAHLLGRAKCVQGDAPVDIHGQGYRLQAANGFFLNLVAPTSLELQGPVVTLVEEEK